MLINTLIVRALAQRQVECHNHETLHPQQTAQVQRKRRTDRTNSTQTNKYIPADIGRQPELHRLSLVVASRIITTTHLHICPPFSTSRRLPGVLVAIWKMDVYTMGITHLHICVHFPHCDCPACKSPCGKWMFIRGAPLTCTFVPIFHIANTWRENRDVENGRL